MLFALSHGFWTDNVSMPIDDPISALQALNESDERQRSPLYRFQKAFLQVVKLFAPLGSELTLDGSLVAFDWLDRWGPDNVAQLVQVLADELKYRGAQIERALQNSETHRNFVAEELPGLVLDAIQRAERTRAKDRIRRLARILVHAGELGPKKSADYAEEMLRIATELDERDLLVLREHVRVQHAMIQKDTGRVKHYDAYSVGREVLRGLSATGFVQGEVDSICAKLEAFGLLSRTERNVNVIANDPTPYALLQKGLDFLDYIKSAEEHY